MPVTTQRTLGQQRNFLHFCAPSPQGSNSVYLPSRFSLLRASSYSSSCHTSRGSGSSMNNQVSISLSMSNPYLRHFRRFHLSFIHVYSILGMINRFDPAVLTFLTDISYLGNRYLYTQRLKVMILLHTPGNLRCFPHSVYVITSFLCTST